MRLKRKLIVSISALLIATMGTALATPSSSTQSQLNNSKKLYNEAVKKVESLEIEVEKLDANIETALEDLEVNKKKVAESKQAISKTESDISVIQSNMDDEQKLFGERMEALYINGVTSYLDILLEAKSFSDLISRIDTVTTLIEYDKQVMADLGTQKTMLATKKQGLEKEQVKLVALETESKAKVKALEEKKTEQNKVIAELTTKQKTYASQIKAYQNALTASLSGTSNNNSSSQGKPSNTGKPGKPNTGDNIVPDRGDGDASGMEIVNYAKRFLGTPYLWGGTTPSGFDCSGFTSYVYRNAAGISLPRQSRVQAGVGTYIGSKGSLQPGDLVFFGSPTHHVGIYVGGGSYIHAPRSGDVVKISPLTRGDFTHGRRVL
ncbi:MAG: NlpC/P60 family protein [Clostridium sp.]